MSLINRPGSELVDDVCKPIRLGSLIRYYSHPPEPTGSRAKVRHGAGGEYVSIVKLPNLSTITPASMNYWLMKSEPSEFGIDDLENRPNQTEPWDGVRNYQARNMMRDEMKPGDLVFFYHSNCKEPGIVGLMSIASESYPDASAFDSGDKHYDPKSDKENPRWFLIDVKFERKFERTISLQELKGHDELDGFTLLRRGNRLSIMPVSQIHWEFILSLE